MNIVHLIGVIKEAFDKQHFIKQADLCPSRPHGVLCCYIELQLTVKRQHATSCTLLLDPLQLRQTTKYRTTAAFFRNNRP